MRVGAEGFREALPPLERVNVVGPSGSGKSTFGRRLAERLGSPFVEMDALFWEADWTEPSDAVFFARLERALRGDRWVLDGNYHRTMRIKWPRTTTVIWLDYSLARVFSQNVRRSLWRAWSGHELWPNTGNRESFRRMFSRQSIVLFSLRTHASQRRRYAAEQRQPSLPHLHVVRLRSRREADDFLRAASG